MSTTDLGISTQRGLSEQPGAVMARPVDERIAGPGEAVISSSSPARGRRRGRPVREVLIISHGTGGPARDVLNGLAEFMRGRVAWSVTVARGEPLGSLVRDRRFDGMINLSLSRAGLEPWLDGGMPVVNLSPRAVGPGAASVVIDDQAVGLMAADHLLDRKLPHYAGFGDCRGQFSEDRLSAFAARVEGAGRSCARQVTPTRGAASMAHLEPEVLDWLASLPKPVGLFAVHDVLALPMISACRLLDLRVPDDVAVVGVNNDPVVTALSEPPLSSVMVPGERIGWLAGELLAKLIAGEADAGEPVTLAPLGVQARQSSDVLAIDDREVVEAYRFIHRHAGAPIQVSDVCEHVGLSRRMLERRFAPAIGRSPGGEIRRARTMLACELLRNTSLPLSEVAQRVGFSSQQGLHRLLRDHVGVTPHAYRKGLSA